MIKSTCAALILGLLKEKPGQKARQLAAATGKSQRTVERILRLLKTQETIEFKGSPKTGGYHVRL